jgi:hypothetical protein
VEVRRAFRIGENVEKAHISPPSRRGRCAL